MAKQLKQYTRVSVRRGVHILKAITIGASAVGVGRPTLYSLALDGWGVHDMVEHLKQEFALAMKLSGAARVSDIHAGILMPQVASTRRNLLGKSTYERTREHI